MIDTADVFTTRTNTCMLPINKEEEVGIHISIVEEEREE